MNEYICLKVTDKEFFSINKSKILLKSELYNGINKDTNLILIGDGKDYTIKFDGLVLNYLNLRNISFAELHNVKANYVRGDRIEIYDNNHIEHLICEYANEEGSVNSKIKHHHDFAFGNTDFIFKDKKYHSIRHNFYLGEFNVHKITNQERLKFLSETLNPVMQKVMIETI